MAKLTSRYPFVTTSHTRLGQWTRAYLGHAGRGKLPVCFPSGHPRPLLSPTDTPQGMLLPAQALLAMPKGPHMLEQIGLTLDSEDLCRSQAACQNCCQCCCCCHCCCCCCCPYTPSSAARSVCHLRCCSHHLSWHSTVLGSVHLSGDGPCC